MFLTNMEVCETRMCRVLKLKSRIKVQENTIREGPESIFFWGH